MQVSKLWAGVMGRMKSPFLDMGKTSGGEEFGLGQPSREAKQAVGYMDQELGQRSGLEVDLKSPEAWSPWGSGRWWGAANRKSRASRAGSWGQESAVF